MVPAGPVEKITDPKAMLRKAMAMEEQSQIDYNNAAKTCGANADSVTKQLFELLTADEERHYDQYHKQRDNIERFGLAYMALQSFNPAPAAAATRRPGLRPRTAG